MRIITLLAPGFLRPHCLWLLLTTLGVTSTPALIASDDGALDAIVSLIASAPSDEAIIERATLWAHDQGRLLELIDGIAAYGISRRSQPVSLAAVAIATKEGWVERSVEILEASLVIDDQATTRHQLAQLWLAGGWPEQARVVSGRHLESDSFSDIRLGLKLLEGATAPTIAAGISTDTIKLVAERSGQWKWASTLLAQRGELDAALEVAISGGLDSLARELLYQGAHPTADAVGLKLARLLGVNHWENNPLIDENSESGARWRASMGFEAMLLSNPYRPDQLPSLREALDLLESSDESSARRAVALWRMGGGGQTRQDVSTRLILDDLKPDWLGPDRLPESIEQQLRRSTDPQDANLAVAAALRAFEGTPMESNLWFQAGRLGHNRDWVERSIRISPGAVVAFEWLPGIEARWKQPFESTTWTHAPVVSDPSHFLPGPTFPAPGALLGSVSGKPVRRPGHPPTRPRFFLQHWKLTDSLAETDAAVRLRITNGAWLRGDDRSLQVIEVAPTTEQVQLELEPMDGQSLIGPDGIPGASILAAIFGISETKELLRVAPEPPPMAISMQSFGEAAARRARDATLMRWIDFRAIDDGTWWVDVAGVSGLFATTAPTPVAIVLPTEQTPSPSNVMPPGPLPTENLILVGTLRHGLQPSASRPVVERFGAPDPLLPAGEKLLVAAGVGDRVVVTDSGLVGYFEPGAAQALWWKQILQPLLPGVGGFAPLPLATVQPQLPWSDAVTPRLIEITADDGTSRFLLLTSDVYIIDAQSVEQIPVPEMAETGFAAAILDDDGQLLVLDALGNNLITQQSVHNLPKEGGYQLIATGTETIILGQQQGQTWLAHFDGKIVREISTPPLPDERDRPQLRVAALGRWRNEVLLVADRLWLLDENGTDHRALTDAPEDGNYRPVHWVQPPPRVEGNRVTIARPWGVVETWSVP